MTVKRIGTLLQVLDTMQRQFGDSKYRTCPLLRGFYTYR